MSSLLQCFVLLIKCNLTKLSSPCSLIVAIRGVHRIGLDVYNLMFKIRSDPKLSNPNPIRVVIKNSNPIRSEESFNMQNKFLIQVEMFNQINIKTRNTCQEADKVTSN